MPLLNPGYILHPEILPLQGHFSAPGENSGCEVKPVRRFRRNLLLRKESTAFHYLESPPAAMVRWDFSFCARLFSFREGLLSGLLEKGRTVHFPFLPCVLSVLKITDNSIYLLISRLINILYLVVQVVASD